jgi:hypothetical protein
MGLYKNNILRFLIRILYYYPISPPTELLALTEELINGMSQEELDANSLNVVRFVAFTCSLNPTASTFVQEWRAKQRDLVCPCAGAATVLAFLNLPSHDQPTVMEVIAAISTHLEARSAHSMTPMERLAAISLWPESKQENLLKASEDKLRILAGFTYARRGFYKLAEAALKESLFRIQWQGANSFQFTLTLAEYVKTCNILEMQKHALDVIDTLKIEYRLLRDHSVENQHLRLSWQIHTLHCQTLMWLNAC